MKLFKTSAELKVYRAELESSHSTIHFVPTMGALHSGHLSLVDTATKEAGSVIVSIFVNPTQFNDPADLRNYPRNLNKDLKFLSSQGKTHAVFAPEPEDIYPEPDTRKFDFGILDKVMEGAHRPGHFNGVAQVVSRLFDIVRPHKAYFGQKDFQQLAVIRELVKKMHFDIDIISCPIVRESDGLAMSSRNQLLSPEERIHAARISQVLFSSAEKKRSMEISELKNWVIAEINSDPLIQVEYFEIVDSLSLIPADSWNIPGEKQACIAVKIGKVRLIDNIKFI